MLTLDQQYAIACDPGAGPTGGLRLVPATVGHYMLLCRLESPLINDPREIRKGDLALALWVLGRPWTKARKQVGDWSTRMWLKYDAKVFEDDPTCMADKLIHLLNYWRYHTVGLKCWDRTGGLNTLPAVFSIQVVLSQLGCLKNDIFNHSLKGALAALTAYNAMSDKDSPLMDDDTLKYQADVTARRAAKLKEGQGG